MMRTVAVAALLLAGVSGCTAPAEQPGSVQTTFSVTSDAFADGGNLPEWSTADAWGGQCTGGNTNPQLSWENPSSSTAGFALTMIDTDAGDCVHWLLADIPVSTTSVERRAADDVRAVGGTGALSVANNGKHLYRPVPPDGPHRYVFTVYALDEVLALESGFTLRDLKTAMSGHVLAKGSITGVQSGPA